MIRLLLSELCVVCVRPVAFRICFRMSHDHRYMASYRHYLIYLLGPDPTTGLKNIKTGPCVFVERERLGEDEVGRLCMYIVYG